MKKKGDSLILYKLLISKINCKKDYDKTISRFKLNIILGVDFHVPKELRDKVISELINMDILEKDTKCKEIYYKVYI